MEMKHPASDGLRQIADELDKLSESGVMPDAELQFRLTKENFSLICKALDLVTDAPSGTGAYDIIGARRMVGRLSIWGWNFRNELCEKRTVTKRVEVWGCGE